MKKTEKFFGRAVVALFASALCFGFASCNFGDSDNNSNSEKKYGVVESFSSKNDYYLAGEKIKSTEYAISFYSNDGVSCTENSLTHSDKLEIQIGKDLNNLRPVVLEETAYETTDKIVLVKVKDSESQDAGKFCKISVIPLTDILTDINSISCVTISIFQNTESIDKKIILKKDTESITNITIFDGFTVKDGFTVWIDNNYGTDKAAKTHDYTEYPSGSDLTDVIRKMKENAKNDENLGKKSHYYSYYVKYNEIISNKDKSICVNNQNL